MTNYLIRSFLWFRERGFVQITQKTLVSLFPFLLFSGIIRVISLSVFSEMGYINQLFQFLIGFRPLRRQVRCLLIFLVFSVD